MRRPALLCLLAALCIAQEVEVLGHVESSRLDELSGLVRAADEGVVWVHNDSGGLPRLYALGLDGRIRATLELAADARDWEDVARLDAEDGPAQLFAADIGDNRAVRESVVVYRVTEPALDARSLRATPDTLTLTYPDSAHDAEVLLIEPPREGSPTGRLLIVTKRHIPNRVYGCALPATGSARLALEDLGAVQGIIDPMLTAGDLSPDGSRVVLRTYTTAFEWDVPDGDVAVALTGARPSRPIALPTQQQGEALGYAPDGSRLLTVSEGERPPLYRITVER